MSKIFERLRAALNGDRNDDLSAPPENQFQKWGQSPYILYQTKLELDPDGFILYWKDNEKNSQYLELCKIRDVRMGKFAEQPNDSNIVTYLSGGHSNLPVMQKNISIYHGCDLVKIKSENFVSLERKPDQIAKKWQEYLLSKTIRKVHYFTPIEEIFKLRSILVYGKSKFYEGGYYISMDSLIDTFIITDKDKFKEISHLKYCLNLTGITVIKDTYIDPREFTCEKFYNFFIMLLERNNLNELFKNYTQKEDLMQLSQFDLFVNRQQRDKRLNPVVHPLKSVDKLLTKYETNEEALKKFALTFDGFVQYLLSDDNDVANKQAYQLSNDMTKPLSYYYINSSHNTYLSGAQFGTPFQKAPVNKEMYIQALLNGCRCIEIDCWDGDGDEPIVTHGPRALCNCEELSLSEVIEIVHEFGFKTSPYPIIISLEDHCSDKMKLKIYEILISILGSKLLDKPLRSYPLKAGVVLPSPDKLKHKVLIKHYRSETDFDDDDLAEDFLQEIDKNGCFSQKNSKSGKSTLSSLVNYMESVGNASFHKQKEKQNHFEIISLNETKAFDRLKNNSIEFLEYGRKSMTRVYPRGTRTDSSNPFPYAYWIIGCQIVALNYQTLDLPMQLNLATFELNNKCGYLLKSVKINESGIGFSYDPFATQPMSNIPAEEAEIQILNGIFCSSQTVPSYALVEFFGIPADTYCGKKYAFKLKVNTINAFNAYFDNEPIRLKRPLLMPKLASIRFSVYDKNDTLVGHRLIPCREDVLNSGYRYITLRNASNQALNLAMLFVKIDFKNHIPPNEKAFVDGLMRPPDVDDIHALNSESVDNSNESFMLSKENLLNRIDFEEEN